MFRTALLCLLLASAAAGWMTPAQATSMRHQNLVDLIDLSELILTGKILSVTDGFQQGVPYTEVTVSVDEAIRGTAAHQYTFRQFGLMAPRDLGDGRTYVGVTPDGLPRFAAGDDVLLFLYKKGSLTGFRTTVGLYQGTFKKEGNLYQNGIANEGLMRGISVKPSLLTPAEQKLLKEKQGPVQADVLLGLVRKAVQERWVETGRLSHVR
jgi:hypothetical protein